MAKRKTLAEIDTAIARWTTKLTRASNTLARLRLQRMRAKQREEKNSNPQRVADSIPASTLVAAIKGHVARVKVTSHPVANPDNVKLTFESVKAAEPIDTTVPDFLLRGPKKPSDEEIAKSIRAEQEYLKKKKAAGRIAKMKAKKSGETKKMPLTGKAALAAIRGD